MTALRNRSTRVHFLDNVIDVSEYQIPQIAEITRLIERSGSAMMGWADLLICSAFPTTLKKRSSSRRSDGIYLT